MIGFNGEQCKKLFSSIDLEKYVDIQLYLYLHRDGLEIDNFYSFFGETKTVTKLQDILCCDGIIISSPNNTHYEYLLFLINNDR